MDVKYVRWHLSYPKIIKERVFLAFNDGHTHIIFTIYCYLYYCCTSFISCTYGLFMNYMNYKTLDPFHIIWYIISVVISYEVSTLLMDEIESSWYLVQPCIHSIMYKTYTIGTIYNYYYIIPTTRHHNS